MFQHALYLEMCSQGKRATLPYKMAVKGREGNLTVNNLTAL